MSPGWATDLAILELTGSTIEHRGDHLVVRTPANPKYHWGNCLLVTDPAAVDDADRWAATFADEFPDATWFAAGLPVMPTDVSAWEHRGIELEQMDVLTTTTVPRAAPLPDGYTVREIAGDDWNLVIARDVARNAATGEYEAAGYERFVRSAVESRRRLCLEGLAVFVGAFSDGDLVADLGIVRCGSRGRYQEVMTNPQHRQRGLASHLLGVAAAWSADRGCESWVIVTESTNAAGRVYRRAGFTLDDAVFTAYRRPPLPGR
jgi:GNAT superfamily N-acetyltransferase